MSEITEPSSGLEKEVIDRVQRSELSKPLTNETFENNISEEKESLAENGHDVLLARGKRHFFIKDYPNAVSLLGDACAKLSELFGDLADECADAYLYYGRALLELAREEVMNLDTPLVKQICGEEEKEEEHHNEANKQDSCKNEDKENSDSAEVEAQSDLLDNIESSEHQNGSNENNSLVADETIDTTTGIEEDGDGETSDEDGNEDEVDNFQLAWEVLELASKIYDRQKLDVKLAEAYFSLGEIAMESENYEGAIDEMSKCLEIRKKVLPPDHRSIAETLFQKGLAAALSNEFDLAIENFKSSKEVLESRITNLQKNNLSKEETDKNPFYSVDKEIEEIKSLLPEINSKIEDMFENKKQTIQSLLDNIKNLPEPHGTNRPGSSQSSLDNSAIIPVKPVSNISHLVRKKRKLDEDSSNSSAVKKTCPDEASQ